jgi:HTH-type transcriptional regulator / antitoxin HigA
MKTGKLIKTEKEYHAALEEIEKLMLSGDKKGAHEDDMYELLTVLIKHYEDVHFPTLPPDPLEAILFRMEQAGLTRKDIEPYFGARSRISEIFNRKRKISPKIAKKLHNGLNIPSDILIEAMA